MSRRPRQAPLFTVMLLSQDCLSQLFTVVLLSQHCPSPPLNAFSSPLALSPWCCSPGTAFHRVCTAFHPWCCTGATAITLIPNIAGDAAHVTMLQVRPPRLHSRAPLWRIPTAAVG